MNNIHELIDQDSVIELDRKEKYFSISFFGYTYLIWPGLWWGDMESNDIIRLCFGFINERHSRNVILPSLRAGDMMIDVGALYGSWTLPAAAMGVRVKAFEPASYGRSILQQHIKLNKFEQRVSIGAETIDSKSNSIDKLVNNRVEFIKIDTEGMEYDVIRGAKNVIEMYKPKLLVELHTDKLDDYLEFFTNLFPTLKYRHFTMNQKQNKDDKLYYHIYHYQ